MRSASRLLLSALAVHSALSLPQSVRYHDGPMSRIFRPAVTLAPNPFTPATLQDAIDGEYEIFCMSSLQF